uniref:Uncharacterized protein n=1 Tax=Arundo donax TaxID=35708 RepID=A0A0A9AXY3_ARUDO
MKKKQNTWCYKRTRLKWYIVPKIRSDDSSKK